MKVTIRSFVAVVMVCLLAGCATDGQTVNTKRGAVVGAAAGAVLGGVIGHQSGHALEGAAVGAGAGAVGGGVLGSAKDEEEGAKSQPQQ